MQREWFLPWVLLLAGCANSPDSQTSAPQQGPGLRELGVIALPAVEGRIDHLAFDAKRMRLYVAALGNNTLEVVDLATRQRVRQIHGCAKPQGVLYIDEFDVVVVSNGESGMLHVFNPATFERVASLDVGKDADNLRWAPRTKEVFVAAGDGELVGVDARTWTITRRFPLSAHPESFQLATSDERIFVNVPDAQQIAVVDRRARAPDMTWPLVGAGANYPMALLEHDRRLVVGCRKPACLIVFDTDGGKLLASLELSEDCDDIFYDMEHDRVFVSCGGGNIDVFERTPGGVLARTHQLPTAGGARTCLLVPQLNRLFLAVPHRGSQAAEIREFELVP